MMLQRWTDHEGVEHRVLDDYNRNVTLCDLKAQPAEIRAKINECINAEIEKQKQIKQVGIRLMNKFELQKVVEQAESFAEPLNARYHNESVPV